VHAAIKDPLRSHAEPALALNANVAFVFTLTFRDLPTGFADAPVMAGQFAGRLTVEHRSAQFAPVAVSPPLLAVNHHVFVRNNNKATSDRHK